MKLLGIDVGESRVGLAISDELAITCRPFGTVTRSEAVEKIADVIETEKVDKLIIGLPLLVSGDEGSQATDVKIFAQELSSKVNLPIDFENEHLSSNEAVSRLTEMGETSPEKASIDAMAACIILEGFIGSNNS